MPDENMPVEEEHFDSIPWSSLIPQTQDRPWLVYVAAGAVVALVLGVLASRSVGTNPPAASPVTDITSPPVTGAAVPPTSQPLSEADLRADFEPGAEGVAAAAMRAEWFVTDYFTLDGAGGRQAELAGALGRPFYTVASDATTYVEWAKAWEVVAEGDGGYRVSVAYRSITAAGAVFERGLVHGVAVRVQVGAEGGTRVVDLPEPVHLPPAPTLADLPLPEPVPEDVAVQARENASNWGGGATATVIEGINDNGRWRVMLELSDTQGTLWPMVTWIEPIESG
jgi:hypothetical protein